MSLKKTIHRHTLHTCNEEGDEASIAVLHGIPMIGLGIVKNTADGTHSDEENQRHAKDGESDLEDVLIALIEAVTKG